MKLMNGYAGRIKAKRGDVRCPASDTLFLMIMNTLEYNNLYSTLVCNSTIFHIGSHLIADIRTAINC